MRKERRKKEREGKIKERRKKGRKDSRGGFNHFHTPVRINTFSQVRQPTTEKLTQ